MSDPPQDPLIVNSHAPPCHALFCQEELGVGRLALRDGSWKIIDACYVEGEETYPGLITIGGGLAGDSIGYRFRRQEQDLETVRRAGDVNRAPAYLHTKTGGFFFFLFFFFFRDLLFGPPSTHVNSDECHPAVP
jgi:hypothetical protein